MARMVFGARDKALCFYCKKRGHTINNCFVLNNKNKTSKAINLLQTEPSTSQQTLPSHATSVKPDDVFSPFIMERYVSLLDGGPKVPVVILRDNAASQSGILEGVLTLTEKSTINADTLVRGLRMRYVRTLHTVYLDSELVKGPVVVGVKDEFPVEGMSLIFGNDLAGGKVLLNPDVIAVPLSQHSDKLEQKYP